MAIFGNSGDSSKPSMSLPNYRFERMIAKGGMSVVWQGLRISDGLDVAIKIITPEFSSLAEVLEKVFKKGSEGEIAATMNHRNVVRTIDYGKKRTQYYIIMEYVDGPPMVQLIRTNEERWRNNKFEMFMAVGRGLAYIHQHNLVHRDFCPKNILVGSDNIPKIIDFGLAIPRSFRGEWKFDRSGTASYMAPEQVRGQQVDVRTDIYAFGVTAYEILTGERPYPESKTRFGKMQPHLNVAPVKPRKYNPLIPVPLEHIILKAMEKARDRRYQTMDAMMKDAQMVCNTFLPHATAAAG